jgi:hypothetical protein
MSDQDWITPECYLSSEAQDSEARESAGSLGYLNQPSPNTFSRSQDICIPWGTDVFSQSAGIVAITNVAET